MQRQLPSSSSTVVLVQDTTPPTVAPIYPTVPITDVPYLEGYSPTVDADEALQYQWDSISDTFLWTTQGRRIVLDRNDFIERYFGDQAPDILAAIDACIVNAAEVRRRQRLMQPIPIDDANRPAAGTYLIQMYFDIPKVDDAPVYMTFPATSGAINRDNIVRWLRQLYEQGQILIDPTDVRIDVIHPLMFDWNTGQPNPGAQEIPVNAAPYELETDALDQFAGFKARLDEDMLPLNSVAVPIVLRPRREMPVRAVRLAAPSAVDEAERLYPNDPFQRRKYILEQLAKRHSKQAKTQREIELFREVSRMIRDQEPLLPSTFMDEIGPDPNDPDRVEARRFLYDIIQGLRAIYEGTRDPEDEETLLRMLVESLLNIDLDAPLDYVNEPNYWREWKYLLKQLSDVAYGGPTARTPQQRRNKEDAQKTLLFMVDILEDIIDDARERWAYVYTATDLWPILDKETGLIIGYKNKESKKIDVNETPLAIEAQTTNIIDAPLGGPIATVRCHKCKRERAANTQGPLPLVHVTYVPETVGTTTTIGGATGNGFATTMPPPSPQQQQQQQLQPPRETEEDCVQFGFVWRDDKTQEDTSVAWNSDTTYVQSVINGQPIAVFARRVEEDPSDKSKLVVDTYNPIIGMISVPAATTSAALIGDVDRNDGTVTLRDRFDQSFPLRGGRAIEFFCVTSDGRTIRFPVRNLVRQRFLRYSCGDTNLSVPPRFAAIAHRLQGLLKVQRENIFAPGTPSRRRLDEQIARLERLLHAAPQESQQELANRANRTFAVHENSEWLKLLDQIDARAIQKWRERTEYGLIAPEAAASEERPSKRRKVAEAAAAERQRELRDVQAEAAEVERARLGLPTDEELIARNVTFEEMLALGIPEARAKKLYDRVLRYDTNIAEAADIARGDFIGGPTASIQDRMDDLRDDIMTKEMMKGEYRERLTDVDDIQERETIQAHIERLDASIQDNIATLDDLSVRVEQDPFQAFKGTRSTVYTRLLEIMARPTYSRGVYYKDLYAPFVQMLTDTGEPAPQTKEEKERLEKTINAVLNPNKRKSIPRVFVIQMRDVKQGLEALGMFILREFIQPSNIANIIAYAVTWARQNGGKRVDVRLLEQRLWQEYLLRLYQDQNILLPQIEADVLTLQQQYPQSQSLIADALERVRPQIEEDESAKLSMAERRQKRKRQSSARNDANSTSTTTDVAPFNPFASTRGVDAASAPNGGSARGTTGSGVGTASSSSSGSFRNSRYPRRNFSSGSGASQPFLFAGATQFSTWADIVSDNNSNNTTTHRDDDDDDDETMYRGGNRTMSAGDFHDDAREEEEDVATRFMTLQTQSGHTYQKPYHAPGKVQSLRQNKVASSASSSPRSYPSYVAQPNHGTFATHTLLRAARESVSHAVRPFRNVMMPHSHYKHTSSDDTMEDSIINDFLTEDRITSLMDLFGNDNAGAVMAINDFAHRVHTLGQALASSPSHYQWNTPLQQTLQTLWQSSLAHSTKRYGIMSGDAPEATVDDLSQSLSTQLNL